MCMCRRFLNTFNDEKRKTNLIQNPHTMLWLTFYPPTDHIAFGPKRNIHRICHHCENLCTTATLWPRDNLLLRHFGPVTIYHCDTLTPWQFITATLWPHDNLLLRHFDPVTIYYCDTLTPWQFITVTLWPRDNLLLRHFDPVYSILQCHPYMKNAESLNLPGSAWHFHRKLHRAHCVLTNNISSKVFLLFLFIKGPNIHT